MAVIGGDPGLDATVGGRMFERVSQQIADNALDARRVKAERGRVALDVEREPNSPTVGLWQHCVDDLRGHFLERDGTEVQWNSARIDARQLEEVVDHAGEALGFAAD